MFKPIFHGVLISTRGGGAVKARITPAVAPTAIKTQRRFWRREVRAGAREWLDSTFT